MGYGSMVALVNVRGAATLNFGIFKKDIKQCLKTIFEIIRLVFLNYAIDGFIITGGDPFY